VWPRVTRVPCMGRSYLIIILPRNLLLLAESISSMTVDSGQLMEEELSKHLCLLIIPACIRSTLASIARGLDVAS
jgi:hypothetical protein